MLPSVNTGITRDAEKHHHHSISEQHKQQVRHEQPRVGFGAQAGYHCRISPPRFLVECRKRRLNQGSFVVLYFNLSALSDLYLVFACLFYCTVFVFSFCMFIFLYCFVCQYQSSDWL